MITDREVVLLMLKKAGIEYWEGEPGELWVSLAGPLGGPSGIFRFNKDGSLREIKSEAIYDHDQ